MPWDMGRLTPHEWQRINDWELVKSETAKANARLAKRT